MPTREPKQPDLTVAFATIRDNHCKNLKALSPAEKIERLKLVCTEANDHAKRVLTKKQYDERQKRLHGSFLRRLYLDSQVMREQLVRLACDLGLIDVHGSPSDDILDRAIDRHLQDAHGFSVDAIAHIREEFPAGTIPAILKDDAEAKQKSVLADVGRGGEMLRPSEFTPSVSRNDLLMGFRVAVSELCVRLKRDPDLVWTREPMTPEGLNTQAINGAAEAAGLPAIFTLGQDGDERWVVVATPTNDPPLRLTTWHRADSTAIQRTARLVGELIDILNNWCTLKTPDAPIPALAGSDLRTLADEIRRVYGPGGISGSILARKARQQLRDLAVELSDRWYAVKPVTRKVEVPLDYPELQGYIDLSAFGGKVNKIEVTCYSDGMQVGHVYVGGHYRKSIPLWRWQNEPAVGSDPALDKWRSIHARLSQVLFWPVPQHPQDKAEGPTSKEAMAVADDLMVLADRLSLPDMDDRSTEAANAPVRHTGEVASGGKRKTRTKPGAVEPRIAEHLARRPHDTVKEVVAAIGCGSVGTVAQSRPWKANQVRIKAAKQRGIDAMALPLKDYLAPVGDDTGAGSRKHRDWVVEVDETMDAKQAEIDRQIDDYASTHPHAEPNEIARAVNKGVTAGYVEQRQATLARLKDQQQRSRAEDDPTEGERQRQVFKKV